MLRFPSLQPDVSMSALLLRQEDRFDLVNLFKKIVVNVIYLFLAALGLHSCMPAFSSFVEKGLLILVAVHRLLIAVVFLVALSKGFRELAGSAVVTRRLSCPKACGIFTDQGLNPCPLHWQADSYPLGHQGRPSSLTF